MLNAAEGRRGAGLREIVVNSTATVVKIFTLRANFVYNLSPSRSERATCL